MPGSSPPKPPSAIDGYRRLERTRSMPPRPAEGTAGGAVRAPARSARVAGALRLVAFIAVLAVIVGTSVGLASADTRPAERTPARPPSEQPTRDGSAARDLPPPRSAVTADGDSVANSRAARDKVAATSDAAASSGAARTTPASRAARAAAAGAGDELPFTGEPQVEHVLLGGSTLVLLGMLAQIAGQPLPATRRQPSASSRTRRSSRLT